MDKLNIIGKNIHKKITNDLEDINFRYLTNIKDFDNAEKELLMFFKKNRKKILREIQLLLVLTEMILKSV